MIPRVSTIRVDDTHRLIPSVVSKSFTFERLADDERDLEALAELDGATNDRMLGEENLLPGISIHELLFGVTYAHIVNAAFTHAAPAGGRFNDSLRGAWYVAFELETAKAEVLHCKRKELDEIGWTEPEKFEFDDYLADFRAEFHDIRKDSRFTACLDPESYVASQQLAATLLTGGSAGIVYPSVRAPKGACLACFRPALVLSVRKGRTLKVLLNGTIR